MIKKFGKVFNCMFLLVILGVDFVWNLVKYKGGYVFV